MQLSRLTTALAITTALVVPAALATPAYAASATYSSPLGFGIQAVAVTSGEFLRIDNRTDHPVTFVYFNQVKSAQGHGGVVEFLMIADAGAVLAVDTAQVTTQQPALQPVLPLT